MYLGTRRRLYCTFRDFPVPPATTGALADPTAITLSAINHTFGTTEVLTPVNDAAGQWHCDWTPATPGDYRIVWTGTGAVSAVDVEAIRVIATG